MNSDVMVALSTATMLCLLIGLVLWVQKRVVIREPPLAEPPLAFLGTAAAGIDPERFERFATTFDARMGAIEQRQLTDEKRLIDTEHDVKNIRAALAALPSKDAVHRLEVDLTALNGKVGAMDGTVLATQRGVERIESLLMLQENRSR